MRLALFFVLLLLAGCAAVPVAQPLPVQPAPACLRQCGPLPVPVDGQEATVARWLYGVLDAYAACATAHRDCMAWVYRQHKKALPGR